MADLQAALAARLAGRTCVVGLGNVERGDDGFGVRLAEALREAGCADVHVAGMSPERWLRHLRQYDTVLFVDAVRMDRAPGTAVLLDAAELVSRYPQVSTHTLSLGTLARLIEAEGKNVLLLGVEPERLTGSCLSACVRISVQALVTILCDLCGVPVPVAARTQSVETQAAILALTGGRS